jgi:LPS-assembly protein
MKNKIIFIIFIIFLQINASFSQEQAFNFKTKNIEILENGQLIKAYNGKAISTDGNIEIEGNNFEYDINAKTLKIFDNGVIFFKPEQLKIKFNDGILDQKKFLLQAYNKIEIEILDNKFEINSNKIVYNYKNKNLFSANKAIIKYNYYNTLKVDNFRYQLKKNILKLNNLNFTDKDKINIKTPIAYINTKTQNLFAKDVYVNLNKKSLNEDNNPRIKGNSIKYDENFTTITKGAFTSCKIKDDCPPWEIRSKKIIHDKKNKTINYEGALVKIYNKPIIYLPRFSHPDPSVKRKSGFLTPSFKNSSNEKNYLTIPYYYVISEDKDLTFSPRFYDQEQLFLQTEFRGVGDKSNYLSDFSFKIDNNNKLKSHFFHSYNKRFNLDNYIASNLNLNIQTITKDTYIKKNKIKSKILDNENILENSLKLNLSKSRSSLNIETVMYENLDKEESDRFEYIIPNINYVKKINNDFNLNGGLTFKSKLFTKNYNTNTKEKVNINNLTFESFPIITKYGFYNNYEFLIKNSLTKAQKSEFYKNKGNLNLSGILQFNSSLPLINENKDYKKISTPKASLKLSPTYTKDISNYDNKIDINNIYSLNRIEKEDVNEGGISLTYGNEFSIFNKLNNVETFNFEIANNIRLEENNDLPSNSQLGQKTSSILNEIYYLPIQNIKLNYNSSIKNNLSDINYQALGAELKIKNLVTKFDYLNQNDFSQNSFINNTTELIIDKNKTLTFSTRKNKTFNLTEYYNLSYEYKNDCLTASFEYNKDYYNDKDIKPNESLNFKLTIIPFSDNLQ